MPLREANTLPWWKNPENEIVKAANRGDPWAKAMVLAAELDERDRKDAA